MQAVIAGKSIDESEVLKVLDKLKQREIFSDVQMLYMCEAGRNSNELSFAISFTFNRPRNEETTDVELGKTVLTGFLPVVS